MSDVSSSESLQGSFSLDDTVGTNTLFVLQFPLEVICFQMLYLFIYHGVSEIGSCYHSIGCITFDCQGVFNVKVTNPEGSVYQMSTSRNFTNWNDPEETTIGIAALNITDSIVNNIGNQLAKFRNIDRPDDSFISDLI